MKLRLTFAFAALTAALVTAVPTDSAAATRPAGPVPWVDHFNTADRSKWSVQDTYTIDATCYKPAAFHTSAGKGRLVVSPSPAAGRRCWSQKRPYQGAYLTTRGHESWTAGSGILIAARVRTPTQAGASAGVWPSFWLRPDDGGIGEIDVLEALGSGGKFGPSEANVVHISIHYDYKGTHPVESIAYRFPAGSPSDGFHNYAVWWQADRLVFYVDGAVAWTRDTTTTPWLREAFGNPARPFHARLTAGIGGRGTWAGDANTATRFPLYYSIESVTVTAKTP